MSDDFIVLETQLGKQGITDWRYSTRRTPAGNKPPLLQLLLASKVHVEFVCNLNRVGVPFIDEWRNVFGNDPFIEDSVFRLAKYAPFCYNFTSVQIIEEIISNHG